MNISIKYHLYYQILNITFTFVPISLCAPIHHPQILNPHALTHLLLVRRLSVTHVCACKPAKEHLAKFYVNQIASNLNLIT